MKTEKLLIVAALGLGAYLFISRRRTTAATANRAAGSTIPIVATTPAGQAQAQAYYGLGQMIGGIMGKVYGGIASSAGASPSPSTIPDDSLAVNTPGLSDPFSYESAAWGE
jgi:hypothetical protein